MPVLNPILGLNRRLHAIRILPFVRANAIAVLILILVAAVATNESIQTLRSTREPQPVPLERILGAQPITNPHVEVTGMVFPRRNVGYTVGRNRPPAFVYVAMLHEPTLRVLMVRFPGDIGHGEPRELIVSGLLQPFDTQVARKLSADNWKIAGLPVERRYVLIAGAKPLPLWLFGSASILAIGSAIMLVIAMIIDRNRISKGATQP